MKKINNIQKLIPFQAQADIVYDPLITMFCLVLYLYTVILFGLT